MNLDSNAETMESSPEPSLEKDIKSPNIVDSEDSEENDIEPPHPPEESSKLQPDDKKNESEESDTQHQRADGRVTTADVNRMKDGVWFLHPDRNQRLSKFWILLILASIIATSGIVGDSPATVIGAMIVAPLMTPILGLMLSIVLMNRKNFLVSLLLVVTGISCSIVIGLVFGFALTPETISKENNSQVAARVSPKIPDLVGALATGAVGSLSLVRRDIADALPGVAISISLVPPLCVAGLMFSTGEVHDAFGALILFTCNFISIQVCGVITMYIYRVNLLAKNPRAKLPTSVLFIFILMLGAVTIPMAITSTRANHERQAEACLHDGIQPVIEPYGWSATIVTANTIGRTLSATVFISGPPPFPDEDDVNVDAISDRISELCPDVNVFKLVFVPVTTYEL